MTNRVDPIYFEELMRRDKKDISEKSLCLFDKTIKGYIVNFMNEDYIIEPSRKRIYSFSDKDKSPGLLTELTIIYYLLYSKEIRISGEWISEKDIPGGSMFFTGPHSIPTERIDSVLTDITDFNSRCENMAGRRIDMGDSAYTIKVLPRVPVTVLYWKGDREYPPQTKILFDRTISTHLSLDVIYGMAVELCIRLSR